MKAYEKVVAATFVRRPNRFVAQVMLEGREVTVHVKNTGRCKELLVPHATVYLAVAPEGAQRKTAYDLVAVEKVSPTGKLLLVNMDAQLPNALAEEYFRRELREKSHITLRREVTYGDSRFDLCLTDTRTGRKTYVEVKGVTLENDGVASFPDAPTERGVKHLKGLAELVREGHDACVFFVVQMKGVHVFKPNDLTHQAFGDALRDAVGHGVRVLCMDCAVTPDAVTVDQHIPVELS